MKAGKVDVRSVCAHQNPYQSGACTHFGHADAEPPVSADKGGRARGVPAPSKCRPTISSTDQKAA
jgi:hypothetical protein